MSEITKEMEKDLSYQKLVARESGKVNSISIASKILQFMQKVRNNSDPRYAKRWTMELMQNTKDCAVDGQKVRVEIEVNDDVMIYRNNSKPFRVKDILSLINQVTSKLEEEETTGKFGTGFMTTMLLSDRVDVSSVLSDRLGDEDLPKKKFHITIDRSAETPEGIIDSIGDAMVQISQADQAEAYADYEPNAFNTEFRYELKSANARNAAVTGVKVLIRAAKYIFAFSDAFDELRIHADCKGYKKDIVIKKEGTEKLADCLARHKIKYGDRYENVLVYSRNEISLAAPEGEEGQILPIKDTDARLYINYPLIGSEGFPFPVVLQCRGLMPDEPRSNIALSDNEESTDSATNRRLILEAIGCYRYFIDDLIALGYGGLENFVRTPVYQPHPEHSEEFVRDNIFAALLSIISSKKIVRCQDGEMRSLKDEKLYLPYGETDEVRQELKSILADCEGVIYPEEPDTWRETLQAYDVSGIRFVTVADIVEFLDFKHVALKADVEEVAWIQKIYDLTRFDERITADIQASRLAIYPTQQFVKRSNGGLGEVRHIYLAKREMISKDPGILEFVKKASEVFDAYERTTPLELRKHLLHKDFRLREGETVRNYYPTNIRNTFDAAFRLEGITDLEDKEKLKKYYSIAAELLNYRKGEQAEKTRKELAECGILQNGDGKEFPEGVTEVFEDENYVRMMAYLTKYLIWCIKPHNSLKETQTWLEEMGFHVPAIRFADDLLGWLRTYAVSMRPEGLRIVPNEEGVYSAMEHLAQNKITDLELYGIAKNLGRSYDSEMLHHGIKSVTLAREISDETVARYLNDFYTNFFEKSHMDINEASEEVQAVSILLFDWIGKHPEEVASYMPYLSEKNSMRLLNLPVVASLNEKAKALDKIAEKYGYDAGNEEEMEKFFSKIEDCEDPEELYCEEVLTARRKARHDLGNYCDENRKTCIYVGDFPQNWQAREREDLCRWVGENGEKYAYDHYVDKYVAKGYRLLQKKEQETVLQNEDGETVSVRRCDTPHLKQPGYDIVIEREDGTKQYVEVKSRTASSVYRDIFDISREQYCCALRHKKDYTVFLPVVSFEKGTEQPHWSTRHVLDGFMENMLDAVEPADRKYHYLVKDVS